MSLLVVPEPPNAGQCTSLNNRVDDKRVETRERPAKLTVEDDQNHANGGGYKFPIFSHIHSSGARGLGPSLIICAIEIS